MSAPAAAARRCGAALLICALWLLTAGSPAAAAPWPEQYWFGRLSVEQAWTLSRGEGVTVAVIDTGVVDTLPSLAGQVLPGIDLTGGGSDGRRDPGESVADGFTFSHGTNMAALIAGRDDAAGMVGIAPGARILPVKVFARTGDAAFNDDQVAEGIRYAVDQGAQVINLSLSGVGECALGMAEAVAYAYRKDVIVVAGAGNQPGAVQSPANCPGALAVTASDRDFVPWKGNATGPEVAFTSVGVDMPQLTLEGGKLTGASGTSGAAAVTSGIFALVRAHYPADSARQIVARVIETAKNDLGAAGRIGDEQGYGQPLPLQAMQTPVAEGAPNPIFDAFDRQLASAPPGGPTGQQPGPTAADPGATGSAPGSTGVAETGGTGGSSAGVLIAVGAGAIIVVLVAGVLISWRGGQRQSGRSGRSGQGAQGRPGGRSGQGGSRPAP